MKTLTKLGLAATAAIAFFSMDVHAQISTATVTINTASTKATGVSAQVGGSSSTSACANSGVTLSVVGGSLGTGATWNWYIGGLLEANRIGTGATVDFTADNITATNKLLDIYVRAEGGVCSPANSDTAHFAFTVFPLPFGELSDVTFCEGEEYELTFDATTPTENGPFDLNIFFNSTTDMTNSHVYDEVVSGTPFVINSIQAPTVAGPNAYNLMEITDDKGCKNSALTE